MNCEINRITGTALYDKNAFFHFYFSNVYISINNEYENLKLRIHVVNIHGEGTVSQMFGSGPSCYSMQKKMGNFLVIVWNIFSTFYKKNE